MKDFNKAYASMVQQMWTDQGLEVSGLLSDSDIKRMSRFKRLNNDEFMKRVDDAIKKKQDKINRIKEEELAKDVKECTFAPDTKLTKDKAAKLELNEKGQKSKKDFENFLKGQERF
jgi:molecular chaperone DnaK (HSP70)